MKSKGFTLVELLAVLVILGIILTIVTTSVFRILEDSKDSAYDSQLEMIKSSVKEYVSDNKRTLFEDKDAICVSISDLYVEKYINEKVDDPRESDGTKLSEFLGYAVVRNEKSFEYILIQNVTDTDNENVKKYCK